MKKINEKPQELFFFILERKKRSKEKRGKEKKEVTTSTTTITTNITNTSSPFLVPNYKIIKINKNIRTQDTTDQFNITL